MKKELFAAAGEAGFVVAEAEAEVGGKGGVGMVGEWEGIMRGGLEMIEAEMTDVIEITIGIAIIKETGTVADREITRIGGIGRETTEGIGTMKVVRITRKRATVIEKVEIESTNEGE